MEESNPAYPEEHDAQAQIGSRAFQEKTGRLEHEKRIEKHVKKLILKDGKINTDIMQSVNCPLCDANDFEEMFKKWEFAYVRCKKCSMIYVNPIVNEEQIDREYESGYEEDWVEMLKNPTQRQFDEPKFLKGIMKIEAMTSSKGNLLDVGCATGHFMEMCNARGWNTTGIEFTRGALEHCKNLGLNVISKKIHEAGFEEKSFDAITLWDVLEHIPNPRGILAEAKKILKDSGVMLLLVPNGGSLASRILQEKCNMFGGLYHINIFTPQTLRRILEESGFAVVHMETIISEINVINNYLNYEHPYAGGQEEKKRLLGFDEFDEEFIHKNLMGYKILCLCKKKS